MNSNFSLLKIINGLSRTINIANQMLPLYNQIKPIISNGSKFLSSINTTSTQKNKTTINSQVKAKILSIINQSPLSAREVMREVGGEPQFIGKIIDELKAEGKIYLSNEGKLVINE